MHFQRSARHLCLMFLLPLVSSLAITRSSSDNALDARTNVTTQYSLPQNAGNSSGRAALIDIKQAGFLYGPAVAGGPYYPTGTLGLAKCAADVAIEGVELGVETKGTISDTTAATLGVLKYGGLDSLDDYVKLYDGEWKNTLPKGPVPGILTNYTQDLLFSMERLSISPYQIRRLNPSSNDLAFDIDDDIAKNITGSTLDELFQAGRIFYADYRNQKNLPSTGRYAAAVDAYFYIDTESDDFLPLAIRTNVGSNLIYTPADEADDWLLAKMMYNVNDFWFAQTDHLALTHEVIQIAYMAAIRALSDDHPVLGLLNRLMYEVFSIQPLAASVLFAPGAGFDQILAFTGATGQNFSSEQYHSGRGWFQDNYFNTDLRRRGLIDADFGPALKNFPFYEDASTIFSAQETFMQSFVASYYPTDSTIKADPELQAWATEANGPAAAYDFPTSFNCTSTLVEVLTHFAHLSSSAHHAVNTNSLLSFSSTLPLHPPSLYTPLPKTKGSITNIADFLPPFTKVIEQFTLAGEFARPALVGTNRTLKYMFDDAGMLARMNSETREAAEVFLHAMEAFSAEVAGRGFDEEGLCQGMPVVWQALDPNVAPFSVSI